MFRVYVRSINDAYVKDADILDCTKVEMVMPGLSIPHSVYIRCYTLTGEVVKYSGPYDLVVTEGENDHAETDN